MVWIQVGEMYIGILIVSVIRTGNNTPALLLFFILCQSTVLSIITCQTKKRTLYTDEDIKKAYSLQTATKLQGTSIGQTQMH